MAQHTKEEVAKALDSSEDDLAAIIGYVLNQNKLNASPEGKQRLIERGRLWIDANFSKLKPRICKNSRVKEFVESGKDSNIELCMIIADAIATQVTIVPPLTISAWIIKKGVKKICE